MAIVTIHVKITGRVQGVGFRWWTRGRAQSLRLRGWVRNDPTGSVSAVFQGEKAAVEQMITECWSGPGAAAVSHVGTDVIEDAIEEPLFDIAL